MSCNAAAYVLQRAFVAAVARTDPLKLAVSLVHRLRDVRCTVDISGVLKTRERPLRMTQCHLVFNLAMATVKENE